MGVPRYTTPVFTLTFSEEGLDLTATTGVFVTFTQACYSVTKTGEDLEVTAKTISIYMDQEETAKFCEGDVEIQANWVTADGNRAASEIVSYPFSRQLLERVVE
jgi:hypothetical protein